jgi:hypothetical protein
LVKILKFLFLTQNKGDICEKTKAQDIYSDKIAEGNGAFLLEQNKSDLMTLYVGIFFLFPLSFIIHYPNRQSSSKTNSSYSN